VLCGDSERADWHNRTVTSDYEHLSSDLAASIKLGYEAEAKFPNIAFETPPDDEIRWLADWLVGDGWTRPPRAQHAR
jgi:hypothetical protein